MKKGDAVLLKGSGRNYFVRAGDGELQTDIGIFQLDELLDLGFGNSIRSHLDFEMKAKRPRLPDLYHRFKRTGAPISQKDMGTIISHTGLNKNDTVLDAGTGSGFLAVHMGSIAKKIITYEVRDEFLEIARNNISLAGLDNVEVRTGDLAQEIHTLDETFDVVTLDMPGAAEVVPGALTVLCPGGFLAVFTPFIEQAKEVRGAMDGTSFEEIVTMECGWREISISERGTRPSTSRIGHTGFITFARAP